MDTKKRKSIKILFMLVLFVSSIFLGLIFVNADDPFISTESLGFELLENETVIHAWNTHNDYYFNASNGVQFTNHYKEYWAHNVMIIGYYNGETWNVLRRTDSLSGFNRQYNGTTNVSMNYTLWKDFTDFGHNYRLAIRYHLGVNDQDLTVIPYIKNLDSSPIDHIIGFAWEMKDIQIAGDQLNDRISINGTQYYLNQTLDATYRNMMAGNESDPYTSSIYSLENAPNGSTDYDLYLKWDPSLNYTVRVKSQSGQYNAPVTWMVTVGQIPANAERYTELHWFDSDTLYERLTSGETGDYSPVLYGSTWSAFTFKVGITGSNVNHTITSISVRGHAHGTPGTATFSIRATTVGGAPTGSDLCSGTSNADSWTSTPAYHEVTLSPAVVLRKDTKYAVVARCSSGSSSSDCIVLQANASGTAYGSTMKCWDSSTSGADPWTDGPYSRNILFSEYGLLYNQAPAASSPSPTNSSTGIALTPKTNITISDGDTDRMTLDFYYNTSGAPTTWTLYGHNSSVLDGTYRQTASFATSGSTKYWWKVYVNDGTVNRSYYYSFTTVATNTAPTFSTPAPANSSTGTELTPNTNITINTGGDADSLTVTFYNNKTGSWVNYGHNNSVGNGTYRQTESFADTYNTKYWWKVTCYDGTVNVSAIYHFTTKAALNAPTQTTPYPSNESYAMYLAKPTCTIVVNDLNGDSLTTYFSENSTGSFIVRQTNVSTNATLSWYFDEATTNGTVYYWKVAVNDGTYNITKIYHFQPLGSTFSVTTDSATGAHTDGAGESYISSNVTLHGTVVDDGNGTVLQEYYTGSEYGAGTRDGFYSEYFDGQTFTPTQSHWLKGIALPLGRYNIAATPGLITIAIRATDVNGKPTGSNLCYGTTNGNTLPYDSSEWRNITFNTPLYLTASTKYAIIANISAPDQDDATWYSRNYGYYSGGNHVFSNDWGVTWYVYSSDFWFMELGSGCNASFEYGPTTEYGWEPLTLSHVSTGSSYAIDVQVSDPGTLWHYRAKISDLSGTNYGSDATFISEPCKPDVNTVAVVGPTHINWSWINGTGGNETIVCMNASGYITDPTVDVIYSGTALYYDKTGLLNDKTYYFTFFTNTTYGATSEYSDPVYYSATTTHTSASTFQFNFPVYLEVGDYVFATGTIQNDTQDPLTNVWVYTHLENSSDSEVPFSNMKYWIVNGFYFYIFSTSRMIPGIYSILVNFTNPDDSSNVEYETELYLSYAGGPGHTITDIHFSFYDNSTGIGINSELFKIYANSTVPLLSSNRVYANTFYHGWTGMTLYYRVDDYFNNQIYPLTGTYETVNITDVGQFIDIPIDWNTFSVKNMNHSIVKLTIENNSRTVSEFLFPYEAYSWNLLDGVYNLTMEYYDTASPTPGSPTETKYADITITSATYYWIQGYDLNDIIIELQVTNSSLSTLILDITTNVNISGSSINTIVTNIVTNLTATESNITSVINNVWNAINLSKSMVSYLNNTIWNNLSTINVNIAAMNNTIIATLSATESNITTQINSIQLTVTNTESNITTQINDVIQNINNWGIYSNQYALLPGTKFHWTMDEPVGDIAREQLNDGVLYNLTAYMNATYVPGKFGKAISTGFDKHGSIENTGLNEEIVYRGNRNFSISCWISIDPSENNSGYILSKPWNGMGDYNWRIGIDNGNQIKFDFGNGTGGTSLQVNSNPVRPLTKNKWYLVTAVIQLNSNGTYTGTLWVDNESTYTTGSIPSFVPDPAQENTNIAVGLIYPYGGTNKVDAFCFNGTIDDIRIYNRSLTQEEINQLYYSSTYMSSSYQLINQLNSMEQYINNTNVSIGSQINLVQQSITNLNSNVTSQANSIKLSITNTESNITTQVNSIWLTVNNTKSSILNQINSVWATVNNTNSNIISQVNSVWQTINNTNASINVQMNLIDQEIENHNTNMTSQTNLVKLSVTNLETNITTQLNSMWLSVNNTNGTTIINQINSVWQTINNTNSNIINQVNDVWQSVNNTNGTINTQINLVDQEISNLNANLTTQINSVKLTVTNTETNITTQVNSLWLSVNNTNSTLLNQINSVWLKVNNTNTQLGNQMNSVWQSINNTNATINVQLNLIDQEIANHNTNMTTQTNAIKLIIDNEETNITTQLNAMWLTVNNTNSSVMTQINSVWQEINNTNADLENQMNSVWQTVNNTNATITIQLNSIEQQILNHNTNLTNQINSVRLSVTNTETNITNQINSVWQTVNNTNGTTIINQINSVWQTINNTGSNINTQLNSVWQTVNNSNATINAQINAVDQEIINHNTNLTTQINTVKVSITNTETNITTQLNAVWQTVNNTNTTIDDMNNTIVTQFSITNSKIDNVTLDVTTSITLFESNLTALNNNIWNAVNITESAIQWMNNSFVNSFNNISNNITHINQSITYVNDTIWNNFTYIDENITSATISIINTIDLTELNLTALNINIWSSLNVTDTIIGYLNTTIWSNLTTIKSTIDNINNQIWTNLTLIDSDIGLINVSIISEINAAESDIEAINMNIWSSLNATDSVIDFINSTIWSNMTIMNATIDTINNKLTIDFTLLNNSVNNINTNIWSNLTAIESKIDALNFTISSNITVNNSQVETMISNLWSSINVTDSIVGYINNTVWTNLTTIDTVVDTINNKITVNLSMLNLTVAYLNNTIWSYFNTVNSNVDSMEINLWSQINNTNDTIHAQLNLIDLEILNTETNITTQINGVETQITNTETNITTQINSFNINISNMNSSIQNQINSVDIEISNLNTNITNQVNSIIANITNTNATIVQQANYILSQITNTESNLTTQINSIDTMITNSEANITAQVNIVLTNLSNINSSIHGQITAIGVSITNTESNLTSQINNVDIEISNFESNMTSQINSVISKVTNTEANITTQLNAVWLSVNNTNGTLIANQINSVWQGINNTNTTLHTQINSISQQVDNTETNITNQINAVSIQITNTESNITNQVNMVNTTITNSNTSIMNQLNTLVSSISTAESNLSTQINSIWNEINTTNSTLGSQINSVSLQITNLNNSIHNQYNLVSTRIQNFETNITTQLNTIDVNITNLNASIINQINSVINSISNTESNITNQMNSVWYSVNNTNATIHTQLNIIEQEITNHNTNLSNQINSMKLVVINQETNITNQLNAIWQTINNTNGSIISNQINSIWQSVNNTNATIHNQINNVWQSVNNTNASISSQFNTVELQVTNLEANITNELNTIQLVIHNIDSNVTTQFNIIESMIVNQGSNITSQINAISVKILNTETNITNQLNSIAADISNINTSMNNQFNTVHLQITNHDTNLSNQVNLIEAAIANQGVNITTQLNTIWTSLNNTNSTILTQVNGLYTSITNFQSNMTNSFTIIHNQITNTEVNITNLINSTNATLVNGLISVLGNVSSGSVSVFEQVGSVMTNMTYALQNLSYINTTLLAANFSVNLTGVLENLTDIMNDLSNVTINISGMNISISNLFNVSISDLNNVTISTWNAVNETNNQSLVIFNYYNTNQGLGLDRETLKILINGSRLMSNVYYCQNGTTYNLTIKDYYNTTLYHNNFTVGGKYTFVDLGLTFHSWKFGNTNYEYYMVSLLKQNATRWWERGIVPYGEVEYIIPSGNYTMRIYDHAYVELINQTYNVTNSKVFVINGSNLTTIINGQSIILGQLLELGGVVNQALHHDITRVCYNVPTIFSILNPEATPLGYTLVCPQITVIATTTNTTAGNNFISRPVMPTTSLSNGTIRIKSDRLYFHWNASLTWANISYGGNYTNYTATTLPLFIDPFSANVTINASENVSIIRETQFQQEKLFDWMKMTEAQNSKYYYTTTVQLVNPFVNNVTMTKLYVYLGYANDTTPDYVTTKLFDVTNGVYVTMGQNFDCSASGIQFYLDSLTNISRSFTASYYGQDTQILPSSASVSVNVYDLVNHNDKNYWHTRAQYVNHATEAFIGTLGISFNFTTGENIIAQQSIEVYDGEQSKYLSRDLGDYMYLGSGGLLISQAQVGTVIPNSARTFDVYWLYTEETVMETQPNFLHLVIIPSGVPFIGVFDVFYLLVCILCVIGTLAAIFAYDRKQQKLNMRIAFITIVCAVVIVILAGGY